MDAITHLVLGAAAGEITVGRQIGKRALLIGGILHFFPDIDVVASFWLPPADNLLAHRGITHSFFFCSIASPLLAYLLYRWQSRVTYWKWLLITFSLTTSHILLDACNAYGTAWLEPFHSIRIAFHTIFVADPFFSIVPIAGVIVLLFTSTTWRHRRQIAVISLILPTLFLLYTFKNKQEVEHHTHSILQKNKIAYSRLLTTPTAFNSWLWFIAAESDDGFHIGHYSVLADKPLRIHFVPKLDSLLSPYRNHHDVNQLITFSQGWYVMTQHEDTLCFNDLRFGQTTGWRDSTASFTFYYYLHPKLNNATVMQRGRLSNWNTQTVRDLTNTILGD